MTLISMIQPALDALGQAPRELQAVDVQLLLECYYPHLSVDRPALIGPLTDDAQCERLSKLLPLAYPGAHQVTILSNVDGASPALQCLPLERLDQVVLNGGTWLYLPPLSRSGTVESFQDIVAHLRSPAGCPWDRKQTHRSMRQGFQEEVYEVLDALDQEDLDALKEELGDVLLHILMQVQIASEGNEFRMSDVVCHVRDKLVHRHPHVFGDLSVSGVEQVLVNWEALKQQEKGARQASASMLDGVSHAMPALARAQSIQRHVDRTGFLPAEVDELLARVCGTLPGLAEETAPAVQETLLGDLLFDLANLARRLGLDAESALREANSRFERRFRAQEQDV